MEFLKKNYEKVILGLVLVGLAVAAVLLLLRVSEQRTWLQGIVEYDVRVAKTELTPLDLSTNEAVLRRLRRPSSASLSRDHNLFNPIQWQRRPDGSLVKMVTGSELGAGALTVTKVSPLRTIISYEGSAPLGNELAHKFKITREAEKTARKRGPVTLQFAGKGTKNDVYVLVDLRPSKEDPKEFVIELLEDRTQVVVAKDKPYEGVAGYMADLRYEPEKQNFIGRRIDDRLVFAGDTNRIVSITSDSVTVEAFSNQKRTTLSTGPKPAPAATAN